MSRRKGLIALVALAATMAWAGPAMAQQQYAQQLQKVSVGALRLASSGPIFIAKDKGYFEAEGLDVEVKTFTAAQQVPVAVTSGDVDFGITGLTAGFYNLAGRGALKIIAAQSREEPGYQLVAYMASHAAHAAGLTKLGDLPGKRVGITTVGSTFHYSLGILAQKYRFDIARVTMVPLQTLPNMAAAFKGSQVDAILAPVNLARALEAEGAGKIIGWVGDETPWQLGALFTSPRLVAERRAVAERFVRAYQRGASDYNRALNAREGGRPAKGPGYDEMLGIVARWVQQPPELVATGLPYVDPQGRLNVQDLYDQVRFWKAQGQVAANVDVDAQAILDLSFVPGHFNLPR